MTNQDKADKEQLKRLAMQSAHTVYFAFLTGLGMAFGALAVTAIQRNRSGK